MLPLDRGFGSIRSTFTLKHSVSVEKKGRAFFGMLCPFDFVHRSQIFLQFSRHKSLIGIEVPGLPRQQRLREKFPGKMCISGWYMLTCVGDVYRTNKQLRVCVLVETNLLCRGPER